MNLRWLFKIRDPMKVYRRSGWGYLFFSVLVFIFSHLSWNSDIHPTSQAATAIVSHLSADNVGCREPHVTRGAWQLSDKALDG